MLKKLMLSIFLLFIAISCKEGYKNKLGTEPDFTLMTESPDVFVQNKLLGRGINMGNMLEGIYEGQMGFSLDEDLYFPIISEAGFNSVRIPIRWSSHADTTSPFKIEDKFVTRIKKVVNTALENDLAVIINVHHFAEMNDNPLANKPKLLAMWKQIGEAFKLYPKEVFFEVFNEPHNYFSAELWNQILVEGIAEIRKTNPYRTLMVGTSPWGGFKGLDSLILPENDNNIITTVHYYEPYKFTHQGAEWSAGTQAYLGTTWGTPEDHTILAAEFEKVTKWGLENNRPLNIGEFGAYLKGEYNSRVRWTTAVVKNALKNKMSYNYWEFCAGFGAWNFDTEKWRDELLAALLSGIMFE